ncbi:hypothetical protein C8Q80DRAFT_1292532 [Daedaleopsis nitida]|nr:hypothetical protein C8Q80DRAFT_1292532 [Daedaleopsis nitida]
MSGHEKPLPNLPSNSDTRARKVSWNLTLTVNARAHLQRFIARALDEEPDVRDREAWAERLEASLDELGSSVSRGGWLAGFRRARHLRRRQYEEEEKRRAEERAKVEKEQEELARSSRAKGRSKLKQSVVDDKHVEDSPNDDRRNASLEQLRELTFKPYIPTPKPSVKHLVLSVVGAPSAEPTEDMGFKLVRSGVHCSFMTGEFVLPQAVSGHESIDGVILYGLDNWDECLLASEDPLQVVGGTFRLKGLSSNTQYYALCRVLRLAVYTYLSLLLEQDLLSNSHVELHYPKPAIPHLPSFPTTPERPSHTTDAKDKSKRDSGAGLWSFLSKKTEDLLNRASHVAPAMARRGSLDIGQRFPRHTSMPHGPDGGFLSRRLSLLSTVSSRASEESTESSRITWAVAVRRIDSWKDLMSTSPGVVFHPPKFLLAIAEQEAKDPSRRLVGDEKAALTSLLGWQSKESLGRTMVGMRGFVQHQGFTVLYSEHVPGTSASALISPPPTPSKSDTSSLESSLRIACGGFRRKWVHYRYYRCGEHWDESLGEAIIRWCNTAEDPCYHPDCHFQRGDHDMRWMHGGVQMIATIALPNPGEASTSDDLIRMWQSCATCGKETPKAIMHDGTYMFSFAKYLELLVYSTAIHNLNPSLCEHTAFPAKPWSGSNSPIPQSRFNIIRRFSHQGFSVTLTLAEIKEVFEVRVPRLQILKRRAEKKPQDSAEQKVSKFAIPPGDAHRALRREIMKWWQGMSEHMDQLENKFIADHPSTFHKSLPRLPSMDDAYDSDGMETPTIRPLPPPGTPITPTPRANPAASTSYSFLPVAPDAASDAPSASTSVLTTNTDITTTTTMTTSTTEDGDSLHLLAGLRHKFQRTEQELYAELAKTPEKSLNDVRRSFVTAARGATRRLAAWEKKHSTQTPSTSTEAPVAPEPEWWKGGCHAVPGGNIIVREDDWGSIIAFTLSTADYQRELSNMSGPRTSAPSAPPSTPTALRPSLFRAGESFKRLVSGSTPQTPDPDTDDAGWQEPETYSAVISRKEHPREGPVSLMGIRDVLRQKTSSDVASPASSSTLAPTGAPSGKLNGQETLRSVRAKPAVELSTAAAGGLVSGMPEAVEAAGKILHDLEAVSKLNQSRSSLADSRHSSSGFVETNIRRGKASSMMSDSDGSTVHEAGSISGVATPPPLPTKDANDDKSAGALPFPSESEPSPTPYKTGSTFTAAFANSLTSAMRYVLKPTDGPRPAAGAPHHGLLFADTPTIDERPHIKYDWTIGKRLRFSCTVYYANQFDQLRRRCGVEDTFMKSMARSENWAAEGGKSRSNFWRTTDNRFIIKTLVNAWNVADLQVLIDLGPSYFKYMEATANRPTVLAKLLGFYTVEIRNLESGATQAKADLLVMENLFYDQKIAKTFDLKGIQGRKVKASTGVNSKTLFDGEWIEGQQRALTLVRPHSKVVLQDAIKADCEFLAKSNIMDYSLLLGIDEENKQMVCGLVDTIGSYTFAKTLEYKAKQGLNSGSGKEVTVIPPNEYQERFVSAMDDYFLACPDKWSRPLDNTPIPDDPADLPSVL